MAFLRPVLPEAMKSAYVASTSDIARASFTQQHLPEEQLWGQLHLSQCANECAAYHPPTGCTSEIQDKTQWGKVNRKTRIL